MAGTGVFRVANGQLLGPDDAICTLRGINIGDDFILRAVTDDQCRPLTTLFPNIQVVRFACYSWPSPTGAIKTAIDRLLANNIVVRVEYHLYPQQSPPNNQQNASFYAAWAAAYKNEPFLQFIAANEPLNPGVTDNHLNTYNAVRNTGNNSIVMFDPIGGGGNDGSTPRQGPAVFDKSRYANLRNVGWDLHVYSWYFSSGTNNVAAITATIRQYIAQCQQLTTLDGAPFVDINEYGDSTDGQNRDSNWQAIIAATHAAGVGTAAWTWNWWPNAGADRLRTGENDIALSDYGQVISNWVKGGKRASRTATASPSVPPSPNGFVVPRDGSRIIDANGNIWTIAASAQVAINGVTDTTTANVIQLAYVSNQVWQENASLLWWAKTLPTDTWMPLDGTRNSPIAGGAPTPSPDGTVVSTVGPAITDSNGNLWKINAASTGTGGKARVTAPLTGTVTTGNWVHGTLAGQQYDVLLPHNYDPNVLYPVLWFLHWNHLADEFLNGGANSIVRDEGGYWNNVNFRRNYPCIVFMPICDQRADTSGGATINWGGYTKADQFSEGANMALLEDAFTRYSIDKTRLYVTGTSLGGHGTWGHMIKFGARAGQRTNHRYFVAGMPCDGWSIEYFPNDAALKAQLANDPIWEFAGENDGSASPFARQWYSSWGGTAPYNGSKAPNSQMRYTQIAGGGHGSGWGAAYNVGSGGNANLDWLFSQTFGTLPGTGVATSQQVSVNGVADATTSNVEKIALVSGRIWYQKNAAAGAGWLYKALPTDSWTASSVGPFATGGGSGLTNWFENPGGDGYLWKTPFYETAQWISTGPVVEQLRNGGFGQPTGHLHRKGDYAAPWVIGRSTDPLVTVRQNDGTKTIQVHIPVGTIVEEPTNSGESVIGGCDVTRPGLIWCANNASISTGSIQASGSVINCSAIQIDNGFGEMMMDAVTGQPGLNNTFGYIQEYELDRILADPNYVVNHMLAYALDARQMKNELIWPLNVLDTSFTNTGLVSQGYTIGIPYTKPRPTGKSRGFYVWFDQLQQFGGFYYNQSGTNCTSFFAYSTRDQGAHNVILTDMANTISEVMGYVSILANQTSMATLKGRVDANSKLAFPAPPPLDLSPVGGVLPTPSSIGAWYPSGYNTYAAKNPTSSTDPQPPVTPTGNTWSVFGGVAPRVPGTAVPLGARRSSASGSIYQAVTAGTTSSESTAPIGTGSNIVDGTVHWRWVANADYSDLPSALAALPATFSSDITVQISKDMPVATTAGVPFFNLAGHAMGNYKLRLTALPGDSIRDALAGQALPVAFNSSAGTSFLQPLATNAGVNYITINDPTVAIDALQFRDPDGTSGSTMFQSQSTNSSLIVRNCIFDGATQGGGASMFELHTAGTVLFANCLIIDRQAGSGSGACFSITNQVPNARFVNCTFVAINAPAAGVLFGNAFAGSGIVRNCGIFGFGNITTSSAWTFDHCVTDRANFGVGVDGGSNRFSRAAAQQFVSPLSDWRLIASSSMIDAGVVTLADIPAGDDLARTSRQQGPFWDVGCIERPAFSMRHVRPQPNRAIRR